MQPHPGQIVALENRMDQDRTTLLMVAAVIEVPVTRSAGLFLL